ncbi:hypothetical protein COO60DRAFT_1464029 [Scenedesmus sp. NREL 46B-D3]|nr:hypothetical protein COO60DRAFT_1464029 [Scenedesmus sp. NREL 46B-D3]
MAHRTKGNTMQTGQECDFRQCSAASGGQQGDYCNSVSSITHRVPVTLTYATFFLHDGQFYGEVDWPQSQQTRPCGGGGLAGGGCDAPCKYVKCQWPLDLYALKIAATPAVVS